MGLEIKHTIKGRTLATALETMACHTRWPVIRGNIAVRYRNLVSGNMEL